VTRLSVWPVRTAMLYLGVGFLIGALMLFEKGARIDPSWLRLLPLHVEFVLIGWTLQLAMGMAFWILPRFCRGAAHGNQTLGWMAYGLLNIGALSVGIGLWLNVPPIVPLIGRLAELLAAISFMLHVWPRIKAPGA
jgi:cbb3-type cytochrome oxidase subunit 1